MEEKITEEIITEDVIASTVEGASEATASDELTQAPAQETPADESGKKDTLFSNKRKLIICAIATVLVVILAVFGLSFVMPKSVTGSWELTVNPEITTDATDDQIEESDRVYYIFEKANRYGNGQWHICFDGGVEYYEYDLLQEDGVKKINLGSQNLEYKITGSKLLGTAKLSVIFPEYTDESTGTTVEAQEYVFEQRRAPKYEKSSYKDYEIDEKLVKEWATNERTLSYFYYSLSYVQTVNFMDTGVMTIHYESADLGLDRYMYYEYTAQNNELTFSLVTDKETKYTVKYDFDENGNLKFTDDTTQASIFADQFFGDFTFYTIENLPEPSQATGDELALYE